MPGAYRAYDSAELLSIVRRVQAKEIKWTEVVKLYEDGKLRVPPTSIKRVLYPKDKAKANIKRLEESGLSSMGAPRQVLTLEQETFLLGLCVEMARQRKPLSPADVMRWAGMVATANGTRNEPTDMRNWLAGFHGRAVREHGIDLEAVQPQQLSKQRAGVLKSGVMGFQAMVTSLLEEEPQLKAQGLVGTGNWDELKLDLNKLLTDGQSLVPAGMPPQWEVDGERCEQITLLAGYMGFRRKGVGDRPCSLAEVRALIRDKKIEPFGDVAGYPKLPAGYWDGEGFCVLVGLLIFKGKTGADPAWLNLVHDKMRLMVATTESGYINTELKYEWYRRCKELEDCPFGKMPTIPNADSHASNESVTMSAEMELEDQTYLVAPPGHSTHLTQQLDQTGGPIQHFKRIGWDLIRHSYRIGGKLSKARIAQAVELALALSFTPATCSWASDRVGWGEDADGNLQYDPMSRPWIVSQLVGDVAAPLAPPGVPLEPTTTEPTPTDQPATTTDQPATICATSPISPPINNALAAFRAGAMDGEAGITAGRDAAMAVLGRGAKAGDGWDNEEDMENGVIDEEGSRSRRHSLPNGRCVSRREFRDGTVRKRRVGRPVTRRPRKA